MRFREPLNDILGRRSKVVLLRHLVLYRRESTGRDLARFTGLDHKTCHDALRDLARHHVVFQRRIGSAWAYSLNSEFPVVREVLEPAFEWERTLPDRLARDVRKFLGRDALSIFLYGSTAKGTDDPNSDVDLLIVTRDRRGIRALDRKLDSDPEWLIDKYRWVPQYLFMDARKFRTQFMNGHYFLKEILRSGRLLDGLQVGELLKHGRPAHRRSRGPKG
jgi:predicted nucleotidyltransferase